MSKSGSTVRVAYARKALASEIRALRKIEAAIIKAKVAIEENSDAVTGATYNQITAVFNQLNVAVTVTDCAVQDAAHKLAQTFLK
jgi:hypothetical protein